MEAATLPAEAGFDFEEQDEQMGPWALLQYMDKYSWKDEDEEPIEPSV